MAYIVITCSIAFFYGAIIVINGFGKIYAARLLVAIMSPTWVSIAHLLIGGFFSQSLAICTGLVIMYISFQRKPQYRIWLFSYAVLIYLFSITYVTLEAPLFGVIEFPFDDFIVFVVTTAWMMGVLFLFKQERENLIADMSQKNEQLKSTTEELERFTYIASHDLKSPLRTIISFIGLIERDIQNEKMEGLGDKLQFVKTGAAQLNFLVQDILELSKLKNIQQQEQSLVDLNMTMEKAKTNLMEDIAENNATVYAQELPHFHCNEVEFLLLFQNFVQNGIKYNESEKPVVTVTSFRAMDTLNIVFKDNGIGIAPEYHQQIFQFFKRLHNSDEYQGTGLGLGLCRKIIDNYDGTVIINSKINEGTTFTLSFPIRETKNTILKVEDLEAAIL